MASSVNRSDNNHREKVQKVFIQRDYSEGTNVKFQTKFPPELEGLIDRHLFEQTVNTLNRIYAEAEKTSTTTFCEGCLACLTSYVVYLCIETHYQKCLKRIAAYLDDQNETVYLPRGLLITDPIERGLRVIEIAILVDPSNLCLKTESVEILQMPKLVEGLCPQLTTDLIRQCKSVGIHTVAEFVSSNIEDLSKKSKILYKDLVNIRHNLLSNYGCFPQRADSLYNILLETMLIISTGNKRINTHLKGGIYAGEVTEIFGSPGSGKTQFCLSVCASLVSESENRVLYLDSNANFSARRLEQILLSRCDDKQEAIESLHKISVVNIRDIYHMFEILESVECELRNQKNTFFGSLKLIVIDSVTCLLSPCFGGKYFDGPSLMGSLARLFKVISCEHMISIMVTNNMVQSENWCVKAGLGPNWKYVPSVSVCIKKGNDSKVRILQTMKSCRNGLKNETTFFISEVGLSD